MSDPLPAKIGRYEVRSLIGEGGFGRVYKAWDPTVHRHVAVKVLGILGSAGMLTRFQNEAAAAGNLHHPNIVTIYEFGSTDDDSPFIAMEYLDGFDLNQYAANAGSITLFDKVRIMAQVGEGLKNAHENSIIHRDVKPANIKVLRNGVVKILDFGIARLTGGDSQRLTQQGYIIGTIRYMSPEHFAGADVTTISDIFAFGVIFYELIAGRHPFDAPDPTAFMYRIAHDTPRPLHELAPECPLALETVVMKAIEKDRDLRYQSLDELLIDLLPIIRELQQDRAAQLFAKTRELFESGCVPEANIAIREVIALDSSNPEVRNLRDRIQEAVHRIAIAPKVDALLKSAAGEMEQRNFSKAIELLESAAKLDPKRSDIVESLQAARQRLDASREAWRLIGEASRELERQNLTLAGRLASEAIHIDPTNQKAVELADRIRENFDKREAQQRLADLLELARRLAAVEDFDSAIKTLQSAGPIADPAGEVPALLANIQQRRAKFLRLEHLRSEKQEVRALIKESRFAEALPRLDALSAEFPDDPDLTDLHAVVREELRLIRRAEDIRQATAQAAEQRSHNRFAEAEETFRRLSSAYPNDSEILMLESESARLREEFERRQKLALVITRAEQLRISKRYEDALRTLDAGVVEFGEDPALIEARKNLDSDWNNQKRRDRVGQAISSARAKMVEGRFDAAVALLQEAVSEDPQNAEARRLLTEAQRLGIAQKIRQAIDQAASQARELARARDYTGALALLQSSLQAHGDDPGLKALVQSLSIEQQQWEDEQRRLQKLDQATIEIRTALQQKRVPDAERLYDEHTRAFGPTPQLTALRKDVDEAVGQRSRRIQAALAQILKLELEKNWDGARQACRAAVSEFPGVAELADAAARIDRHIAQAEREAKIRAMEADFRSTLAARDWKAASRKLDELAQKYPEASSLPGLRAELEKEKARAEADQAVADLTKTIARKDWENARRLLAQASKASPQDARLSALGAAIQRGQLREQTLQAARAALVKGKFADAETALRPLLADPQDTEAAALFREAGAQRAAAEVEDLIRAGRAKAQGLSRDGKFEEAIAQVQALVQRHGERQELTRDLNEYTAANDRQKAIARAAELVPPTSIPATEPPPRAIPLPPAPSARRRWVVIAGLAAVVVFGVGITLYVTHRPAVVQTDGGTKKPDITSSSDKPATKSDGGSIAPPDTGPAAGNPPSASKDEKKADGKKTDEKKTEQSDPREVATRIYVLVNRRDWNAVSRELDKLPRALRATPEIQKLDEVLKTHNVNARTLQQAQTDLRADKLDTAEKEAQALGNTEFSADARTVLDGVRNRVNALAAQVTTQIQNKDAAQAQQALKLAVAAYPSDIRWPQFDQQIRVLLAPVEKKADPKPVDPCPVPPAELPNTGAAEFNGTPTRNYIWMGNLAASCTLKLFGNAPGLNGVIPRVAASVSVDSPRNVMLVESPNAANNFKIVLRNDTNGPVTSIRLVWTLAQR